MDSQTMKQDVNFLALALEQRLTDLNPLEVRYSRGFLCADLETYFPTLADHWKPFFLGAGVELRLNAVVKHLHFPQELGRIVVVEAAGESCVIGIDELSQDVFARALVRNVGQTAGEVLIEYLERRLLTTLTKSWGENEPFVCYYLSSDWAEEVEVIGAVEVELLVGVEKATVWFGIGPRALDMFDRIWRNRRSKAKSVRGRTEFGDSVHSISVEIAQLSVPPAMLIDYMRAGSVIDLEMPVSENVVLLKNGEPWVGGVLRQFNGSFAVEVTDLAPPGLETIEGATRVQVELARVELDENAVQEYFQVGAVLPTSRQVGSPAALVINGETVAQAILGEADGNLALSVLPK